MGRRRDDMEMGGSPEKAAWDAIRYSDTLKRETNRRAEVAGRLDFHTRASAFPEVRRFLPEASRVKDMSPEQWAETQKSLLRFFPYLAKPAERAFTEGRAAAVGATAVGDQGVHSPTVMSGPGNPQLDSLRRLPGYGAARITGAGIVVPAEAGRNPDGSIAYRDVAVSPSARIAATMLTGVDPQSVPMAQRTANLRRAVGQNPADYNSQGLKIEKPIVPDVTKYMDKPPLSPEAVANVGRVAGAPMDANQLLTDPRGAASFNPADAPMMAGPGVFSLGGPLPASPNYPISASQRAGAVVRSAIGGAYDSTRAAIGNVASAVAAPIKTAYGAAKDFIAGAGGDSVASGVSRASAAQFEKPTLDQPLGTPTSPALDIDKGAGSIANFGGLGLDDELKKREQFAGF